MFLSIIYAADSGEVGVNVSDFCSLGTANQTLYVPVDYLYSRYSFLFNISNNGNVPLTVGSKSTTTVPIDPSSSDYAYYSVFGFPMINVTVSNAESGSCTTLAAGNNLLPNESASQLQLCDNLDFSNSKDMLSVNGSFYVYYDMYSGNYPGKNDSIILYINYSGENFSCSQNQLVTFVFTGSAPNVSFVTLLNGTTVNIFAVSGQPVNITIINISSGTSVRVVEKNGWLPLVLPQYQSSVVSNEAVAYITPVSYPTSLGKTAPFTIVPTGGLPAYDSSVGNYSTRVEVLDSGGTVRGTIYLNVTVRDLGNSAASNYAHITPPNKQNLIYINDYVYRLYDRYVNYNGGPTYSITIYSNDTSSGFPSSVQAGLPMGLNLTVLDTSDVPIAGARVEIVEKNGYQAWALSQYSEAASANVTNYGYGYANTSAQGTTALTINPTGGLAGQESKIGVYSLTLRVKNSMGAYIFSRDFTVNRTFLSPSAYGGAALPNNNNIVYGRDYVYRSYDRITGWLSQ